MLSSSICWDSTWWSPSGRNRATMKIHHVKRARKTHYCDNCREDIEPGESYIWWRPRGSSYIKWHAYHGRPPRSLLTTSEGKRTVYIGQEKFVGFLRIVRGMIYDKVDHNSMIKYLKRGSYILYDLIDRARNVSNDYCTSASHIEQNFGNTSVVESCLDKSERIDEWADEITGLYCGWDNVIDKLTKDAKDYKRLKEFIDDCEEAVDSLNI